MNNVGARKNLKRAILMEKLDLNFTDTKLHFQRSFSYHIDEKSKTVINCPTCGSLTKSKISKIPDIHKMNSTKNQNPAFIFYKDSTGKLTVNDDDGRFQGNLKYFKSGWCAKCSEDTYKNEKIGWFIRNRSLAHSVTGATARCSADSVDEGETFFQQEVMRFVRDAYRNQRLSAPKYRRWQIKHSQSDSSGECFH